MSKFNTMSDADVIRVLWSIKPRCHWHRDPATNNFVWDESEIAMPTDTEIETALTRINASYCQNRSHAYPVTDDQLDSIFKGFKYLKDNGVDIGPDAGAWVDALEAVKTEFPKS